MNVLVINSGSSSMKCALFRMPRRRCLARCSVERIAEGDSAVTFESEAAEFTRSCKAPDHREALKIAVETLVEGSGRTGGCEAQVDAVGHRVVHGGEDATASALVTESLLGVIRANADLAPLHNPANLAGLEAAVEMWPERPQVAVFDTAFHASMPPKAYLYALPYEFYREHHVRRYGFHGTSHSFVAERAAELLSLPYRDCNLITLHLGNGCSATAIRRGVSVDTSMGLTPLEGLVMGTRSGDVDPSLPFFLSDRLGMDSEEVYDLLNDRSGLRGLSGKSKDMRDVLAAADGGDARAEIAVEVFCYRARKYIGAYCAALGTVDAVVFTAGIGENSPRIRQLICEGLGPLGICLDPSRNEAAVGVEGLVSTDDSPTAALVVPTDEELKIAIDTHRVCSAHPPDPPVQ